MSAAPFAPYSKMLDAVAAENTPGTEPGDCDVKGLDAQYIRAFGC